MGNTVINVYYLCVEGGLITLCYNVLGGTFGPGTNNSKLLLPQQIPAHNDDFIGECYQLGGPLNIVALICTFDFRLVYSIAILNKADTLK